MTRGHDESVKTKNPMLEHVAALEERIAALEKEVSHLRSIPKKKSLKAIKPPANLKVMGKREQKKRGILAQLELLNVPADISMSTPELKALLSKNKKAESSRKKTEADIRKIEAKTEKAQLKLKKKKDAEEKKKAKAAKAAAELSLHEENGKKMVEFGVFAPLIALAKSGDKYCEDEAVTALANLALTEENQAEFQKEGGMEAMEMMALSRNPKVVKIAKRLTMRVRMTKLRTAARFAGKMAAVQKDELMKKGEWDEDGHKDAFSGA